MAEKKRIIWIELLRIASCFGVILLHMGSQHFHSAPVDSYAWMMSNLYHGLSRFAVGCFIMISGALYLSRAREWSIKQLWRKSIFPIIVSYMFWQLFYAVYSGVRLNMPLLSIRLAKHVLTEISTPYFHLWYLPLLIEFLILTPVLWEIVNCKRGKILEEYLIGLFFFFQITKTSVGHFPHRYDMLIENLMNTVQPELVTNYIGYYILGHYLYHYQLPKKLEKLLYVLGVVSIGTGILLCQYFSLKTGHATQSYYENHTFAAFFWSISFFLFFKNHISRIQWKKNTEKAICTIGSSTFGIYLIHVLIRNGLQTLGIHALTFNELFSIPLLAFTIFSTACIIVLLLKKVPALDKWLL